MSEVPIVELIVPQRRRRFLGFGGVASIPDPEPQAELLVIDRANGGPPRLERVTPQSRGTGHMGENASFARVRTTAQPLQLSFAAVTTDNESHAWDLILQGSWAVTDPIAFMAKWAIQAVSPSVPLDASVVLSWMASSARNRVIDATRGKSIQYLRDEEGLPPPWWEKRLCEWLGPGGIGPHVTAVQWESADAARASAEQQRLEELSQMEQACRQQYTAELREAQAKAEYQRQQERIAADTSVSHMEQTHRQHLAELQYHREVLEIESQIEAARRSAEQAALEHQQTMARLSDDKNAARLAAQRQSEAQDRQAQMSAKLTSTQRTLERLDTIPGDVLRQLTGTDAARSFQAAERLTSPEFGLSPQDLAILGFSVGRQMLVSLLNDNTKSQGHQIVLTKQELRTRDIGVAKVKALSIGSSLEFELLSHRPGYLTLLNIGTSSSTYIHIPSALVSPQAACVQPGRTYSIPGPELFPWQGDYREEGPTGWEHLAAIVSDQPLIPPELSGRSSLELPIVKLSDTDLESLMTDLLNRPAGTWFARVLSFLVSH